MATRIKSRPVLLSTAILVAISRAAICLADDPHRPPPLTFDKHVDYLGWYDELVSKGKSNNALELYQKLSPEGKDGFHNPQGKAETQFNEAIKRPWDASEFPDLKLYLDQNESQFRLFKKATERKHFWQVRDAKSKTLIEILFPSLSPSRDICKSLIVQGWMRDDHQAERMFANWQTIFANAKHFSEQPILIGQLASSAEQYLVYRQACSAIYMGILNEESVAQAIATLRKFEPATPRLVGTVVLEWGFVLDTLQSVCKGDQLNLTQWRSFCHTVDTWPPIKNEKVEPLIDPKETLDAIEEYFAQLRTALQEQPVLEQVRTLRALRQEFEPVKKQNAFLKRMLADYSRACELMLRTEVRRRGTILVLALHEYKYKSKKWPAKLDNLKIDELETLQLDPYSDKDFIYRLTPVGPLLYSIAADGKDNNGRHDPKWGEGPNGGDFVLWPVQEEAESKDAKTPKKGH